MQRFAYFFLGTLLGGLVVAAGLKAAQPAVRDALDVAPQYYTVRIDNDRVRVLEYHLKPGESEPMHSHAAGVAYIVSGAKVRTILPNGNQEEGELKTGDVHWRPENVAHAVENIGTTEERAIIVELKDKK